MFNRVCIIGFGLIGSSLARAIVKHNLAKEIICVDQSQKACDRVLELGLAKKATTDLKAGVQGCDLVILAIPVGAYSAVAKVIGPHLQSGTIVTDTGSVKQAVIDAVVPYIPAGVFFVPGHPIAGTEHSGPDAGFAELFTGRWSILTPLPGTDTDALAKVKAFWEACEAKVEIMDPKRHDLVLGITSHLPHLIAYTIVGTASDLEEHTKDDVIKFSAGGFRDFTRIAASDPIMWRDIFVNNQSAVLEILQRFNEDLTSLQRAIRNGDGAALETLFTRTREIRRGVIQARQEVPPVKKGS
jgi:cyclohexadieny/prephenate dehydrogenase